MLFLPELTEKGLIQTEELDEIKRMARGKRIFSLVGHQTTRKGVLEFLRLAKIFPRIKGFFCLLVNLHQKVLICSLLSKQFYYSNCLPRREHIIWGVLFAQVVKNRENSVNYLLIILKSTIRKIAKLCN